MQNKQKTSKMPILLEDSNHFFQDLFGYFPQKTRLEQVSKDKWEEFMNSKHLEPNSTGAYVLRKQTAIIQQDNPLSLFHEYFGHGLYCEQTLEGIKLIDLEKKLLEEEKIRFNRGKFTLEELNKFRESNPTANELSNLKQHNHTEYELFAIWTEYLLSKEFNLNELFYKEYNSLSKDLKEKVDLKINLSEHLGPLTIGYDFGLSRKTTPERAKKILKDIYGEDIQKIKLAFLYGSKKEFSDIDIFVISESIHDLNLDWLDVRTYNQETFEKMFKLFDVSVAIPINTGEYILGDASYLDEFKKRLSTQPVTEEAISYNIKRGKEQAILSLIYPKGSNERKRGLSYFNSFIKMAEQLNKRLIK